MSKRDVTDDVLLFGALVERLAQEPHVSRETRDAANDLLIALRNRHSVESFSAEEAQKGE